MSKLFRNCLIVVLFLLFFFPTISNGEVTLEVASEVKVGQPVTISFSGATKEKDFITIVEADAPEKRYKQYKYIGKLTQVALNAPTYPGDYEIRYLDNESRLTLAKQSLRVIDVVVTLDAPAEAIAGSTIPVVWQGPRYEEDMLTIVEADARDGAYKRYEYLKNSKDRKTTILNVPEYPGDYEIRYLIGVDRRTIARKALLVTDVTGVVIEAPGTVSAGARVVINWTGPNYETDFITIVDKDAKEGSYKKYVYTRSSKDRKTIELTAPDRAGEYEIRYASGAVHRTLASQPLIVTSTTASLETPSSVTAGSLFQVRWNGPENSGDFITIVEKGARERTYSHYRYIERFKMQKYLELEAPEVPGDYEVRYLTGGDYLTLAANPITVSRATAKLFVSSPVVALDPMIVTWEGPSNAQDYISIAIPGSKADAFVRWSTIGTKKEVRIAAPSEAGNYEVRYVTGRKDYILATEPLVVTAAAIPGKLEVTSKSAHGAGIKVDRAVEIILDASGSMLKQLEGRRRIEIAKDAVKNLVTDVLPRGVPFAMRVFGHREADSCKTDLEIPLAALEPTKVITLVAQLEAMNLAKTPIAASLEMVASDLGSVEGEKVVILLTDGEETCEGDPKQAITKLLSSGIDVRVNVIGFAIDDLQLKETFQEWARLGKGSYFDARNAEELKQGLRGSIDLSFRVEKPDGTFVSSGVVNGAAVTLLSGSYRVVIASNPPKIIDGVVVEPNGTKQVSF